MNFKFVFAAFLGCAALSACSSDVTPEDPPAPQTKPNETLVTKYNTTNARLQTHDLSCARTYSSGYGYVYAYTSNAVAKNPCRADFVRDISTSHQELAQTRDAVGYYSQYASEAWAFAMKVQDSFWSLDGIETAQKRYCPEHPRLVACLGDENQLQVLINRNITGYARIHPIFRMTQTGEIAFIHFSTDDVIDRYPLRGLNVSNSLDSGISTDEALMRSATRERFDAVANCMNAAPHESDIAKLLVLAANKAMIDADAICARIAGNEAATPKEKEFCGL